MWILIALAVIIIITVAKEGDYLLWIPENEAYQLLTEGEFNEQFETL